MKPSRNLLALLAFALGLPQTSHAQTLYRDGNDTTAGNAGSVTIATGGAGERPQAPSVPDSRAAVPIDVVAMKRIHEEVKTPYKYGIVLRGTAEEKIDCPNVFRHGDTWFMMYIAFDGRGYETRLARSTNLLDH